MTKQTTWRWLYGGAVRYKFISMLTQINSDSRASTVNVWRAVRRNETLPLIFAVEQVENCAL